MTTHVQRPATVTARIATHPQPATPPASPETGARRIQGPTQEQAAELAALFGLCTLRDLDDLATIADLHAELQQARGSNTAASQYRQTAHHIRQAVTTLAHGDTGTNKDQQATADMAGAYLAAALVHAHEADLTAI
ncbi:hypothetical protein ACH4UR_25480 [Streptomyces lydicus]|uniref:hypothetical protein n=1 Tax=Streptomyces lydicus TaxID=47763 RepID=UPI0033E5E198